MMHKTKTPTNYTLFFQDYPDLLTTCDIKKILAVSDKTVLRILQAGQLRSIKVGRSYRIPKLYLLQYLGMIYTEDL